MNNFKKRVALMLAFILTLSVTSATTALAVQSTHTIEHDGFTLEFKVHSSWASGYNAEIVLTNNTDNGLYQWVLNLNQDMGLLENGVQGGKLAHQEAGVTTIGYIDWNSYIPAGGYITLWLTNTSTAGVVPVPTDFRINQATRRLVPTEDFTWTVNHHNEWSPGRFGLGLSTVNVSDRVIQGWELEFDINGWLETTSIGTITYATTGSALSTTGSAIIIHTPRSNQSWHPGQNNYFTLGGMGTGVTVTNLRIYEMVAKPYLDFASGDVNLPPAPPNEPPTINRPNRPDGPSRPTTSPRRGRTIRNPRVVTVPTPTPTPPISTPSPEVPPAADIPDNDSAYNNTFSLDLTILIEAEVDVILVSNCERVRVSLPQSLILELKSLDINEEDVYVNITISEDAYEGFVYFNINITIGDTTITNFENNFYIDVSLEGFDLAGLNLFRITGIQNGRNLGGYFDTETGWFEFDTQTAGYFSVAYVQNLRRINVQLDSQWIVDLAGNAETQVMDVLPVIQYGRTLLPLRFVSDALDANIDWIPATEYTPLTIILSNDGRVLSFAIGELAPGMDIPAQLINDRTMVPLRFISEFFDAHVTWNDYTRTIEIVK